MPNKAKPTCPNWLDKEAKKVWKQVTEILDELRILSRTDTNVISRYCVMFVRWKKAEEFLARNGHAYVTKKEDGSIQSVRQYPQVAVANNLTLNLLRIEQEFGLTPSARSRIQIDFPNEEVDELQRFIDEGASR